MPLHPLVRVGLTIATVAIGVSSTVVPQTCAMTCGVRGSASGSQASAEPFLARRDDLNPFYRAPALAVRSAARSLFVAGRASWVGADTPRGGCVTRATRCGTTAKAGKLNLWKVLGRG